MGRDRVSQNSDTPTGEIVLLFDMVLSTLAEPSG